MPPIGPHMNQAVIGDVIGDAWATSGNRRHAQPRAVVEDGAANHRSRIKRRAPAILVDQFTGRDLGPGQKIMARQIAGRLWRTLKRQIIRGCAQNTWNISQFAAPQANVLQRCTAQGHIKAALDQIKACIRQAQVQRDLRIGCVKRRQQRHHVQLRATTRRGKTQGAGRLPNIQAKRRPTHF